MGNRAVITFDSVDSNAIAVYVHWNGGRDSIEGFLKVTRILMGGHNFDELYATGRFIQVVGAYFPGALSFGVGQYKSMENWDSDNGVYIVDSKTMTIKGRRHASDYNGEYNTFVEQKSHNLNEFANELIKIINAGYEVYNEGMTYPEPLLPTAEEWDATHPEEKELGIY